MNVVEVQNEDLWNEFLNAQSTASFLQSWEWGVFQEKSRVEVKRWMDTEQTIAAQVFVQKLGRGLTRWYVPRGPIGEMAHAGAFVEFLTDAARQDDVTLLHIDPVEAIDIPTDAEHETREPRATQMIDLTRSQDEMLAQMKSKTRYNIRVSAKHRVKIEHGTDKKSIDAFLTLSKETAKRQKIRLHADQYYRTMVEELAPHKMCDIVIASHKGKPLAALLLIKYRDTLTYLHGASTASDRNVMAPYAAHWFAMQQAKEEGFTQYDLWGVAPDGEKNHPYSAITRFKLGFGGTYHEYPKAIIKKTSSLSFTLYDLYRKVRRS